MRRLAPLALAGVLAPLLLLPAVPAGGAVNEGIGIRLLDAPVARKDDPRARLYVVDHVAPGASISRRFEVSNGTPDRVTLQLYAAAASVEGGWNVAGGRASNELVEWTTVTPSTVDLAPGAVATAVVAVKVPPKASAGERYAAVLAELPPKSTQGGPVLTASRVGIRMYLDVGPGGEPASDFTVDSLIAQRAKDGTPEVTAVVTNTGGRALDLSGQLTLTDGPGGLRAGPFPVENVRTLGVKATGDVLLRLDKALPAGPWHARIDMQSGRLKRAAEATITFPTAAGDVSPPVKAKNIPLAKDRKILVPVAVGLIALVLVLLFVLWLLAKKRNKRKEEEPAQAQ
jgi:hypothetical protein